MQGKFLFYAASRQHQKDVPSTEYDFDRLDWAEPQALLTTDLIEDSMTTQNSRKSHLTTRIPKCFPSYKRNRTWVLHTRKEP